MLMNSAIFVLIFILSSLTLIVLIAAMRAPDEGWEVEEVDELQSSMDIASKSH